MPTVRKSVIVAQPRETLFDLVDAVESYPQFLPWCSAVTVYARDESLTHARLEIDYHGLKSHFTTVNRKERPGNMAIALVEGPFERFSGEWRFVELGADGCRVEFSLDYALASGALQAVLAPVFGHIVGTLVDRFVERAERL